MNRGFECKNILAIEKPWYYHTKKYPDNYIFNNDKIMPMKYFPDLGISSGIGTEEEIIKIIHVVFDSKAGIYCSFFFSRSS